MEFRGNVGTQEGRSDDPPIFFSFAARASLTITQARGELGTATWVFGYLSSRAPIRTTHLPCSHPPWHRGFAKLRPLEHEQRTADINGRNYLSPFSGCKVVGSVWRYVGQGLRGKRTLKTQERKQAGSHAAPTEKALFLQQREEVGPRTQVTVNLSRLFWEFVCLEQFGKMARWSSCKLGGMPACVFVVSPGVEQSDFRERWFHVHFHFSCGISRFTVDGVWVDEKVILLPLG